MPSSAQMPLGLCVKSLGWESQLRDWLIFAENPDDKL